MPAFVVAFDRPLRAASLATGALATATPDPLAAAPAAAGPAPHEQLLALLGSLGEQLQRRTAAAAESRQQVMLAAVELAVAAAAQLLADDSAHTAEAARARVEALWRQLPGDEPARATLNPEDLRLLTPLLAEQSPWTPDQLRLSSDAGLPRGVCRVECRQGALVSDWARQLVEIHEHLLERVHDR